MYTHNSEHELNQTIDNLYECEQELLKELWEAEKWFNEECMPYFSSACDGDEKDGSVGELRYQIRIGHVSECADKVARAWDAVVEFRENDMAEYGLWDKSMQGGKG